MAFTLAPLPYSHDALEPHIDTLPCRSIMESITRLMLTT